MSRLDRFSFFLLAAGLTVISIPFSHAQPQADTMQQSYGTSGQPMNSSGQPQNFTNIQHDRKDSDSYWNETGAKFTNSMANIVTSPVEIVKNIINTNNESNIFYGLVGGSVKGIVNMGGRVAVGLTDLLTFPLPTKPIVYPLYVWEDFNSDTSYGEVFRLQD